MLFGITHFYAVPLTSLGNPNLFISHLFSSCHKQNFHATFLELQKECVQTFWSVQASCKQKKKLKLKQKERNSRICIFKSHPRIRNESNHQWKIICTLAGLDLQSGPPNSFCFLCLNIYSLCIDGICNIRKASWKR